MQKEVGQWQEQVQVLQERLDRVHIAHQEAEEEEQVLQQLKLACILPEDQQRDSSLHQLSGELTTGADRQACAAMHEEDRVTKKRTDYAFWSQLTKAPERGGCWASLWASTVITPWSKVQARLMAQVRI